MPYDDLTYPRFGGFSLRDEDEEERRRRQLQELAAVQSRANAMQAPQAPQAMPETLRPQLSALLPRDDEMDYRWRNAEQAALDKSGYLGSQSYGVGEAVRDFAPLAIGGTLDVLLNKGRGLGVLTGAAMEANATEAVRRQKQAQAAGDFALSARDQRESTRNGPLDAAYKQAQIENWQAQDERARLNIENRGRNTDLRAVMQQYKLDPNNPEAVSKARLIQELSNVDMSGLSNAAQASLMSLLSGNQKLENAQPIAAASAQGRIDTELANEPATTAAAARKAAAEASARTRATASAERADSSEEDIGNSEITDPKVWASASRNTTSVGNANKIAAAAAQFDQAMGDMSALQAKNGTMVMPSGDKSAYDAAQTAAIGGLTTLFQTGVINEQEYKRYIQRIPESGVSKGSVYGAITDKNVVGEQIAGTRGELLKIFDRGLGQYGRRYKAPSAQPQNSPSPAAGAGPENLGVTGGRRISDTPAIPLGGGVSQARGQAPMSGGVVNARGTVRLVDPEGEEGDVPAELAEQLMRMGYRRVQ